MHNFGEHKQVQARQEWLRMRLQGIHTAPALDSSMEVDKARSMLHPEELPDLTPEEIQYALSFLEKLLMSKQSWLCLIRLDSFVLFDQHFLQAFGLLSIFLFNSKLF